MEKVKPFEQFEVVKDITFDDINGMMRIKRRKMYAVTSEFVDAIKVLGTSYCDLNRVIQDNFEKVFNQIYNSQFGRLPGSERTSRLRKKRKSMVIERVAKWIAD